MLQDYITDTQALLHDTSGLFTPVAQLTRYINMARHQVAYHTGCLRILVCGNAAFGSGSAPGIMTPGPALPGAAAPGIAANPLFTTIQGVERYPYGYANRLIADQNSGVKGIIDVFNVAVSWGGVRPTLAWLPWDELQSYARSFNNGVSSLPFYYSTFGDGEHGEIWLFPVPSSAMEMEWDTSCVPLDLNTNDDTEALPQPFQSAVKYYAAGQAYLGSQRNAQAEQMFRLFADNIGVGRVASDRGRVSNYYFGSF